LRDILEHDIDRFRRRGAGLFGAFLASIFALAIACPTSVLPSRSMNSAGVIAAERGRSKTNRVLPKMNQASRMGSHLR
jgi:hypothetical protein